MNTPLLWHIPLSHFSEKVRWALAHNRRVLGPDYLIRAWRAVGNQYVPLTSWPFRRSATRTRSRHCCRQVTG
jgi:hypothetical protein